jgi:ADP-ribose pyrophosphatase YjhB (NUDIX family)
MTEELDVLLSGLTVAEEGEAAWPDGLRLRVRGYLTDAAPPLACVSSVRAVVLRGEEVLVFRDRGGRPHLLPGGRREGDEPVEATVRREVREETGWEISRLRPLGFIHFRHLTPKPAGYRYPYPDFVQLVYAAEAERDTPGAPIEDDWVVGSCLVAVEEARTLGIAPGEMLFLDGALRQRGQDQPRPGSAPPRSPPPGG